MEEEIDQIETSPILQTPVPPQKGNLPKLILFVILGLIIVVGMVYAGITFSKKQISDLITKRTVPTSIPKPTEIIPTPDETANWKAYTNKRYGFEFKYPQFWYIFSKKKPEGNSVLDLGFSKTAVLEGAEPVDNLVGVTVFIVQKSPSELQKTFTEQGETYTGNINVGGKESMRLTYKGIDNTDNFRVMVELGSNLTFMLSSNSKEQVSDQILSTFKFLGQDQNDETANWKTYKNEKYGFKFEYPGKWIYKEDNSGKNRNGLIITLVEGEISVFATKSNLAIDKYIESEFCATIGVCNLIKESVDFISNGNTGKKIRPGGPLPNETIIFNKKQTVVEFSFNYNGENYENYSNKENKNLFDQILSTFRFD